MPHIYDRLKVRSVINAYETVSLVGGTHERIEVLEAMMQATERFVHIPELQEKVGLRIAELTNNEAAIVTNGALAGLVLATAACMAKFDDSFLHHFQLPGSYKASRDEIIVQRCQYTPYLSNIRQVGARIVEVGYTHGITTAHFRAAISPRTAAIFYSVGKPYERYALPLEKVVEIAHSHDIPVIVDAASSLPPADRLWEYTRLGADLVAFSGGKGMRGPQDTGFVVGLKSLISSITDQNSPRQGIGRAMKSSKEDIVGLLVALEAFLTEDHAARYGQLMLQARRIAKKLAELSGVEVWTIPDGRQGQYYPRTAMKLLPASGWSRDEFRRALRQGDPSIEVGDLDEDVWSIYVNPFSLNEYEEEVVIDRIRDLLELKARPSDEPT